MSIPEYVCSQINLPMCKALEINPTKYQSRKSSLFGLEFSAGYTLVMLLISIAMTVRMIAQVNSLYSSIGRGEMKIIFYLYISSALLIAMATSFEKYIPKLVFSIISSVQLSVCTTMFFGIFIAGNTIDKIYGIMKMSSDQFMGMITIFYFVLMLSFVIMSAAISNNYVFIMTQIVNTMSIILYVVIQMRKLKRIKADMWPYGILGLIVAFYILGLAHMLVGADIILLLSSNNLDNLFFMSLFHFLMLIMIHKYWLGTCDFEVECLTLEM